jgi:4-amino-4-deoxy-L-arabinose transferase-like glycosyltransferase
MGRGRTYRRSLGWAVAAFLPWALIWPWLLHARSPELLEEWIWLNNIGRFTGDAALGPERDHWMYLRILLVFSFPALPLALWSLWHADGPGRPGLSDPGIALPLVLFGVSFLILSSSSSSRNIYALPLLVPLCLLAVADAGSLTSWIARALDAAVRWAASALAVLMWAAWLAFMVGWPPLTARLLAAHPGFQPQVVAVPLLAALALSAGWLFLLYRREKGGMPFLWTGGVALVWGLAMTLWLPYLDHAKSYRAVMSELRRHLPADSCVASVGLRESQLAMLHYFAGVVPVRHGTQAAEACSYVLVEGSGRFGKLLWSGSRSGDSAERFALYTVRPKP